MQLTHTSSISRKLLPPGVKLFRPPRDSNYEAERRRLQSADYKYVTTMGSDIGLYAKLLVHDRMLPKTPNDIDRYNLVGNFVRSHNILIEELDPAIESTVEIKGQYQRESASGFVLNLDGERFIVTAAHISPIKRMVSGSNETVTCISSDEEYPLRREQLIYPILYPENLMGSLALPFADIAIFQYDGKLGGIPLEPYSESVIKPLFILGFPAEVREMVTQYHKLPFASYGFGAYERESENYSSTHLSNLFNIHPTALQVRKLFSNAVSLPGSSGGPVVNISGELVGVVCGRCNDYSDVRDKTIVFPIKEVLDSMGLIR